MASLYSNENFPRRVVEELRQLGHDGVIVCTRDDANPLAFAERIHAALTMHPNPAGQLIRIVRPAS